MSKRVYLSSPTMHDLEMKYIQEAFDTNWVAPLGKNVDEFENEMASFIGVSHCSSTYFWYCCASSCFKSSVTYSKETLYSALILPSQLPLILFPMKVVFKSS